MEIIKRGELPTERKYEATCDNCKTEIRFAKSEAAVVRDQRDGDYLSIRCPLCTKLIMVSL